MDTFLLVFFTLMLIISSLLTYFGIMIFRKSEKMPGWRNLAIFALSLSGVGIFGMIRSAAQNLPVLYSFALIGISLSCLVGIWSICVGSLMLLQELGIQVKILTKKTMFIIIGIILIIGIIPIALNIFDEPLRHLYTAISFGLAIAYFLAAVHFISISKMTKNSVWILMSIATVIAGLSLLLNVYTGSCCDPSGPLGSDTYCTESSIAYRLLYHNQYCPQEVLLVNKPAYLGILVALITITSAYFIMCRKFFGMFGGKSA